MEKRDTERPFTKGQERHLLRLAKKLFMEQHPNPQRIGCPGAQLLKAVAYASSDLPPAQQHAAGLTPFDRGAPLDQRLALRGNRGKAVAARAAVQRVHGQGAPAIRRPPR